MTHLKRHNQLTLQMGTSHSVGILSSLAPMSHSTCVTIMTLKRDLRRPPSQWEYSATSGAVLTWKSGANIYFFCMIPMNLLLWGCKTWSMRKALSNKLEVFLHCSIRRILRVSVCVFWPPVTDKLLSSMRFQSLVLSQ